MYDELLKNPNIRYLNDLQLSKCIEKLILHCSYNNTFKWTNLFEITNEYTACRPYNDEVRGKIYKRYRRIMERISSTTPPSSPSPSKINLETRFDSISLFLTRIIYNNIAYFINKPKIQSDSEILDLINSSNITSSNKDELSIIKGIIFLSLYINVHYAAQISALNSSSEGDSPYPLEFYTRISETFNEPELVLNFLSIVLDNLGNCIDNRISELDAEISTLEPHQQHLIQHVVDFLAKNGARSADTLVQKPNECDEQLKNGSNIIEHKFLTQLREYIVPFCRFLLEKFAYSSLLQQREIPRLNIDNHSLQTLAHDFSKVCPHVPISTEFAKIAVGTSNVLFMFLSELRNTAFFALIMLPEFDEGVNRITDFEHFCYSRKIYPTKSSLRKQKKQKE